MEETISAKDLISKYFYDFSANIMEVISANEAMTLGGLPGMILAFCVVAELVYIILDHINGANVLDRVLKLSLYFGLTLIVFGKVGYSSLNLTSNLPSSIRPVGKSDLLRDTHAFLRHYFDNVGSAITGALPGNDGKDVSITTIVKKSGLTRQICDTQAGGDSAKIACVKKYQAMEFKDVEAEFENATKCGTGASIAGMPDFVCRLPHYFTMEYLFVLIVKVLYLFRFIGFLIILFGYILTVVMTYMLLKILFPFIVFLKTRDQILSSTKFFMSTTTIVALLGFIEYVINLCLASLMLTAAEVGTESWSQFGLYFVLSSILCIIVFGVEIAMYFKVPSISKQVWDLNISGLVTISEAAKDGLKLGIQLLGLGGQAASLGVMTGIAKTLGLSKALPGAGAGGSNPIPPSGGAGGSSGGSPSGSNFSRGDQESSTSSYPGRDRTTEGRYAPGGGNSISRNAPESQVDPSELAAFDHKSEAGSESSQKNDSKHSNKSEGSSPSDNSSTGGTSNTPSSNGPSQAAPRGAPPKSEVDPEALNSMGGNSKKSSLNKKTSQNGVVSKVASGATGIVKSGADYVKERAGSIANMKKDDWMQLGKTGAKGAWNAAKFAGGAAMHAAAGDLSGAFDLATTKPVEKLNEFNKNAKEKILERNFEKKWGGSIDLNDLENSKAGALSSTFGLEGKKEHDKIEKEISSLEDRKTRLNQELSDARMRNPVSNGGQEAEVIRKKIAKVDSEIDNKKVSLESKREEYVAAKERFIEDLKDDDFNQSEQDELRALLADPNSFTSDELKDIFTNPEVREFARLNELRIQMEKETARIEGMISDDLKKSKGQYVSSKTRAELKESWKVLDHKERSRLLELANGKTVSGPNKKPGK